MSTIIDEVAIPFCEQTHLKFLKSPDGTSISIPFAAPAPSVGSLIFFIDADDEADEATVAVGLGHIPAERLSDVALLIAKHNARFRFVTFSMTAAGGLAADVCVELAFASERVPLVGLAFTRLHRAVYTILPELQKVVMDGNQGAPMTELANGQLSALLASMTSHSAQA